MERTVVRRFQEGGRTVTKGGSEHRGGESTPAQEQERSSTGEIGFENSLPPVVVTGPDDEHTGSAGERLEKTGGTVGEQSGVAERDMTDEELIKEIERLRAGVLDGSVPIFFDGESAFRYWSERFGR
jgi:hypothetical protein